MPREKLETAKESRLNAKKLRKNLTKEESHLWYDFLRDLKPKFQRQKAVGNYILDFYCAKCKLAVELDGSQHFEDDALEYDARRTAYLNSIGIEVLRFTNRDVNCEFNNVCETIYNAVVLKA